MDDLKNRFNPRSEEEGLKIEAEDAVKKLVESDAAFSDASTVSPKETAEDSDKIPAAKSEVDSDLAGLISDLDVSKAPGSKESSTEETTSAETDKKEPAEEPAQQQDSSLIQSTYEVKVKLADLQADPNSPLYSVKSFEELGL